MRTWKTLSRRILLDRSPWVSVESHVVGLPDGRVIEDWPWLECREFVNVVAVTEAGSFLVFRQTKYAVEGTTLAPVGGYLDPARGARRVAEPVADDLEEQELLSMTGADVQEALLAGEFKVMSWATVVALALLATERGTG